MSNTRSAFFLSKIRSLKLTGNWIELFDVWNDGVQLAPGGPPGPPTPNTGYFSGGSTGTPETSRMDKVTYSTDTTAYTPTANLNQYIIALSATGNSTHGYFGGGYNAYYFTASYRTQMDKVSYYTDTRTYTPSANLTNYCYDGAATGNLTAGYFAGGSSPSSTRNSRMDKVTYSTDTTAYTPSANLSAGRYGVAATGNSTNGYFGGGRNSTSPGFSSTMDKLNYSTDTTVYTPGANLNNFIIQTAATGNSTNGYFGGGGIPTQIAVMNKITYSTDTRTYTPSANLSFSRRLLAATGNSTNGYFGGGYASIPRSSDVSRSIMDKVTYSTDTTAYTPSANLTEARHALAASSSKANALPGIGPQVPPTPTPTPQTVDLEVTTANTGYFGGGFLPGPLSTMDKLTYSTETAAYTPSANLSLARYSPTATGNSTNGYFGGGYNGIEVSRTDKVTYSTDTTAYTPSANMIYNVHAQASTGNSTHGYFGGGYLISSPESLVFMLKTTYSSDTTGVIPSANLSQDRGGFAATGNSTHGYFGGGTRHISGFSFANTSVMDKVTYSNDTTSYIPGANLSDVRSNLAATGNSTAGYFGGGNPGPVSKMDKVTYSTDTRAYTPSANLSVARTNISATGNSTAGYFAGGYDGSSRLSLFDKVTYSTDTTAYIPGANLSNARSALAASSARANALPESIPGIFQVIV